MKKDKVTLNFNCQYYKNIPLKLEHRYYGDCKAKRYKINDTVQCVWIPNQYLKDDGTIKEGSNLDFVFRLASRQGKLEYAFCEDPYKPSVLKG